MFLVISRRTLDGRCYFLKASARLLLGQQGPTLSWPKSRFLHPTPSPERYSRARNPPMIIMVHTKAVMEQGLVEPSRRASEHE